MHDSPGIDDDTLQRVVARFYERVRADAALGPVFDGAIHDWPAHLETLSAFWSSVMLTSGRYKGNPMAAHLKHQARITPALFERWLDLWAQATDELLAADAAAAMQAKAARIARSLQYALSPLPLPGAA
jgi:hemoglobin